MLASVCQKTQGSYSDEVLAYLAEAEDIYVQAYGPTCASLYSVYDNMIDYFDFFGAQEDMLEPYAKLLLVIEHTQLDGRDSVLYAHTLCDIGLCYLYMNEPQSALPYFLEFHYIFQNRDIGDASEVLELLYADLELDAIPFEAWLEQEMEKIAARGDAPLRVEGFAHLYDAA